MKSEIWIKVLDEWVTQGMGDNGCTIPFLAGIGSLYPNATTPKRADIEKILYYIFANRNASEVYRIGICPKLKFPIVEKSVGKVSLDYSEGEWRGEHRLVFIDQKLLGYGASPTDNDILVGLINDATGKVDNGQYSISKSKNWGDYSFDEKEFIRRIINKYAEPNS
jgi:hypothetical protein